MTLEWYKWYPALYRADTMHLSAEQDGIYRRLIDHYMETRQPLPDNDAALARVAGIGADIWEREKSIIRSFFRSSKTGKLFHKRCDIELQRQDGRNRSQSEKGKKGAKVRWENIDVNQCNNSSGHDDPIANAWPGDARLEETRGEKKEVGDFFFSGNAIKLTKSDYDRWERSYHTIPDLWAELTAIDNKLDPAEKWFPKVSGWLRSKHEKMLKFKGTKWHDTPANKMPSPAGG